MERVCPVCGESMEDRRSDALTCSPACRRERHRLLAILRGETVTPYASVHQRLDAAHKRANGATGGAFHLS